MGSSLGVSSTKSRICHSSKQPELSEILEHPVHKLDQEVGDGQSCDLANG